MKIPDIVCVLIDAAAAAWLFTLYVLGGSGWYLAGAILCTLSAVLWAARAER